MRARPLFWGYSWVGILNQLIIQWFFIRLQVTCNSMEDRNIEALSIIGFILPLTGWWNDYVFLGRKHSLTGCPRKK